MLNNDPIELSVFITESTFVVCLLIAMFIKFTFPNRKAWIDTTRLAAGYGGELNGVVLLCAATTIRAPVVPFIIGALGLTSFALGFVIARGPSKPTKKNP